MAKFTYKDALPEVDDYLLDAAGEAADSKIAQLKKRGYNFERVSEDDMKDKYVNDYYATLKKNLDGLEFDEKNIRDLEAFTGDNMLAWLEQGGQDPFSLAKAEEFKKWSNVLEMGEDGRRAYESMTTDQLAEDALSKGYKWYDMGDRSAYMDKIRELAAIADKGDIVNKELNSPAGVLTQAFFPSATEAAVAQAMGSGGDDQEIWNALGIDTAANLFMAKAPSLGIIKGKPVVNGVIDATLQGVAEAGRSAASDKNQGKEVDIEKAAKTGGTSAGLGFTVPGLVGVASGAVSQVPGLRNFGRGLSQSTRAADPVTAERNVIAKALKDSKKFNENIRLNPKNEQLAGSATKGETYRSVLGGGDDAEVLGMYDKTVAGEGVLNTNLPINATAAEREAYDKAKQALPAAVQALEDQNNTAGLGKKLGKGLLDVGGRVEPIVQGNPFKGNVREYDYKNADWYKKMTKQQQDAFDAAMKMKADN